MYDFIMAAALLPQWGKQNSRQSETRAGPEDQSGKSGLGWVSEGGGLEQEGVCTCSRTDRLGRESLCTSVHRHTLLMPCRRGALSETESRP